MAEGELWSLSLISRNGTKSEVASSDFAIDNCIRRYGRSGKCGELHCVHSYFSLEMCPFRIQITWWTENTIRNDISACHLEFFIVHSNWQRMPCVSWNGAICFFRPINDISNTNYRNAACFRHPASDTDVESKPTHSRRERHSSIDSIQQIQIEMTTSCENRKKKEKKKSQCKLFLVWAHNSSDSCIFCWYSYYTLFYARHKPTYPECVPFVRSLLLQTRCQLARIVLRLHILFINSSA